MFRLNTTLDATRKEVNAGMVQPNMLKSYKGCCSLEILIVSTNAPFNTYLPSTFINVHSS